MEEPRMREESLRAQISLGWITNLLVGCVMLTFMIIESVLADNDFRDLRIDPGVEGAKGSLVYLLAFYALMPVYVNLVNGIRSRIFRWIAVACAALGFVFFLLHHLSHWYFGARPDFTSHVLDLTLHTVGLWVLVNSVKWAKLPAAVRDTDKAFAPDLVQTER
jgi:hypothetical protein